MRQSSLARNLLHELIVIPQENEVRIIETINTEEIGWSSNYTRGFFEYKIEDEVENDLK